MDVSASDARAVARAESTIRAGGKHSLHYAVKGLVSTSSGVAAVTERLCEEAERLHPPPTRPVEEIAPEERENWATHTVDEETVKKVVIGWVCNGSSPGPSGWTGEMLGTVVRDEECLTGFTALINVLLAGSFEPFASARALLLCSHLVMILKKKADGSQGGARPIAMGEVLWKTAVLCLKREMGDTMLELAGEDFKKKISLIVGSRVKRASKADTTDD
jgi:hypothetical protein